MKEKARIAIIVLFFVVLGAVLLLFAYRLWFFSRFLVTENFVESFDKQYMYTQLSSPKKTICTLVIFENSDSGKEISYTLPYFSERTMKKIVWGLATNDLFFSSSDTGLTIYRSIDGIWTPCYLIVEDNPDGTLAYSLYQGGNKEQRELRYELPSETIPNDIKTQISDDMQKYGDKVYQAPDW